LFGLFAGLAIAQVGGSGQSQLVCYTNVTVTPALRAEGYTEATGDITISCTGGVAPAPGSFIPLVNISIFYSTNVTSRLIPTAGSTATSEALLLIDEPGSGLPGYGASLPQVLCTTPLTGCLAAVGAIPGPTLNTAVIPGTSTPASNVYQGVVSGNAVTFFGVPVLPAGASAWRVFRITNVRLNAQLLAGGDASPVPAWISISGATALALSRANLTVGYVMNGLTASTGVAANFSRYSSQTKTSAATLTFSESFGTAFKTRVAAQSNNLYAGQIQNPVQNVPGTVYNSESGFVLPVNGTQVTGLADFGTRLKATFNNVPAGMRVFVSTANVNSNDSPVAVPNPIGGSQANTGAFGAYTGYAVLVNNESIIDGNAGGGAFPMVTPTDSGPGSTGIVPIAEVALNNGTGSAIWEVVNTNPNTIESFKFAVYATYTANANQSAPPDATTVNLSFAPSVATGDAGGSGIPLPRFAPASSSVLPVFNLCTTSSCLTIANTHSGSFMQGQSGAAYTVMVSNQSGANPTSGTVTVTETAPSGLTLVSMSGSGWGCVANVCTRSDALAGGATYPPIVVTVNVAAGASPQVTNQVTVSGGGSGAATTSDPTAVITLASPVLGISKTHENVFVQGQSGAAYTVTVWNQAGAGPTSGTVTVTDTVPAGLTLALMYGPGWVCAGNACSRSDALASGASYPSVIVIVNVAANATSPQVNTVRVSGGGAADAVASDPTVITGGNLLTCTTNVAVTPQLRGEGLTELTGDITMSCAGGTVPAPGSAIPPVDITVTYNTNVTSRLLPRGTPQASNYTSEALLIIDEPGSGLPGYGPSLPQMLCTTPLTGCTAYVGAVSGPTLGTAVSSGSTPAPNTYQGVVNGNSVTFFGVPVLPPAATSLRIFRITNVRVNAQPLAGGSQPGAMPVQTSISVNNASSMPIVNPAPIVAYVSNGLSASAGSTANLSQCSNQTKTAVATLTFAENFGTVFKTRVAPQSNTLFAGQINNPVQNIPGAIYNSESGFVFPISSTQAAGLSDYGTRLKASFSGVPAGVRIFVSTVNVNNSAFPVTPPNPPGGMVVSSYAVLVSGETTSDGNAGGPSIFPGVAATDNGPNNGNVPIVELAVINGTATAVWEVVNTIPFTLESFKFAVYVTYTADVTHNSPAPGTATVHLSYAATAYSGVAGDSSIPLPRFVLDSSVTAPVFTIQACTITSSLGIAKTHSGSFTQSQQGAIYSVVVSNGTTIGPSSGVVTVTENLPANLTLVSMSGAGWTCPGTAANNCTRSDVLAAGASYPAITVTVNVASNAGSPLLNSVSVSGGGSLDSSAVDSTVISAGAPQALRFVPLTPCRIADTRNANGPFGGPNLAAGISRDFNPTASSCGIPANALAYSLNMAVVPLAPLGFFSVWPAGQPQPVVSTLNSFDGRIKANAAIVPAGVNGALTMYATDPAHLIVDINGYFIPASGSQNLAFYPVTPCRIADTRNSTGTFGGPSLAGGVARAFPVPSSNCGIPADAQAYALNMTVVPRSALGFLSTWPAGSQQPLVSTLNALTGAVTSNAAIVPAGVNGAISVYASETTDLIIDINGYFAPPGTGSLDFYTVTPCRVLDTRNAAGALGGPIMGAGKSRSFIVPSSVCGIPAGAKAYSLNATVVPPAPLSFLTLWGSGGMPLVSTLNSLDATVVANAALVPAGAGGEVTAYTTNLSHLLLDINGYFW
jgi:uncharacterized repeat protein (TIGR01451 family)